MISPVNIIAELYNANIQIGKKAVLQKVQFSIAETEFCYIIGKTGSGKSSLLKTLYGELPLKSGEGKIFDYDLRKLKSNDIPFLRRKLGMVFQNFQLFEDLSVEKNIDIALRVTGWRSKDEIKLRIQEVLESVNLLNKRSEIIQNISGGEKQRVAIARAIINHPKLILGDEPTGNLDPETAEEILMLLRNLAIRQKTAVIISTHNYELIDKFPARVYECKDNTLQEVQ